MERYQEKDYISAASILYPRIEGIMRAHHIDHNPQVNASQKAMVRSITGTSNVAGRELSLLLPTNFRRYLDEVYFASFDPNNPVGLNRNTVSHGVAPEDDFSLKGATIGLLILEQLTFYLTSSLQP